MIMNLLQPQYYNDLYIIFDFNVIVFIKLINDKFFIKIFIGESGIYIISEISKYFNCIKLFKIIVFNSFIKI